MLGATLELSSPEFFSELKTIHLGQTGYITVNSAHTMVNIYHPDRSRIMHPVPPAYKSPALHRAINGWEGVTEAEISTGEAMLVAYRHMHSVDWVVGGLLPRDEAYASLHRLTVTLVMGGVLLLILILPLTWWWMRRLLTPLDTLKEQVASLQHAPAQLPLRISGAAELQAVAESVSKVFVEREDFAQRLAEREVFFRTLNEDSPFGIFVIEADGHINYINRAAAQLAPPRGERDWVGDHWLDLVHAEERNGLAQSWRESVILNGRFRTQCRLSHREGGDALVELHFSPLLNGEREQSLVIMLDVTEREEAKSALLAERERAMAILASIADAVVLTNEHDEVMFLNMLKQRRCWAWQPARRTASRWPNLPALPSQTAPPCRCSARWRRCVVAVRWNWSC
ncbi:PAS domain-containing protein [Paludibacterium denitrificans]|uniref:PAS domain-containing protein n=1 Tax=Paludibacterium denitrificans TaxID=2675226 RepID=A0A844GC67_9NEIS|nr:PAS domain-containing protein [Paludibacterium denitrificans]MTD32891.1 PAS domain-containing protein [Paludibacterium denitrificans]